MNVLDRIVPEAAERQIPFLMIGGNAVVAYGFQRQTADLDLLIRQEDRQAWDELAISLGYARIISKPIS